MCFGGNVAPLSSHYLNSQLGALWDNAKLCAAHSQYDFKSEEYERSKYTRALFHYHHLGRRVPKGGNVSELPFFAEFGKPELKFICNHDVTLTLTITTGHISLGPEHGRGGERRNTTLENVKLVYRMPFERSNVKGNDTKIGNESSVHLIQMIALQLDSATLVKHERLSGLEPQLHNGFFERMRDYLKFLHSAGHHVLFDLSDFDDNKYRPLIDYSVAQESVLASEDFSIFGVTIKSINDYLERQWMAAASLLTTLQDDVESRLPDICLAELSSNWTQSEVIDQSFYIRFGAPTIRALCAREIILYFYVEDIAFFGGTEFELIEPDQVCHKWRVAFVLNVVQHPDEAGALILDFGHPRFSIHDSTFDKEHRHFFDSLVIFLQQEYISIVARYPLQFIYRPQAVVIDVTTRGRGHSTWSDTDELESDWESSSTQTGIAIQTTFWTRRVHDLHLANYDQVATISEDSINTLFQIRRKAVSVTDILATWTEDIFQAEFGAIRVRLLSDGRAIVYITIESGQIPVRTAESASQVPFWRRLGVPTTHGSKTEPWSFDSVVLAFEVDLAFETAGFFDFESHVLADIQTGLSVGESVLLKHLALDLRSAKFNRSLSSIRTLGTDRDALGKLDTLMHYVISYLGRLSEHGHGVLYSTTIAADRHRESLSFTEVDYKVLTKHDVSVHHIAHAHRTRLDSSFILIYGVCSNRPLVPFVGGWSPFWLPSGRGRTGLGTICFSRELFLERYLLKYLQEFNAETTIVPKFAGVVNGTLKFDLTTWAEHDYRGRAGEVCAWRAGAPSDKVLEYVWHHRDDWRHQYEGSSYTNEKGEYSLSCDTNNTLRIPTEHRPGRPLEIVMTGKTTIKVSGKVGGKVWSKTTDALWSTTVAISSRHNGLHVAVQSTKPVVELAGGHLDSGDFGVDVADIHRKSLSVHKFSGLETSLRGIKAVLESAWGYSASGAQTFAFVNPVFTQHGDLVVELSLYDKLRTDLASPRGTPRATPRHSSFGALGKPPLGNGNGYPNGNGSVSRTVSSQEGYVATPTSLLQRSFSAASAPETPLETPASALTAPGVPFSPAEGKASEGGEPVAFSLQQTEAV